MRQQLGANPVDLPLLLTHLRGKPRRGLVGIGERAFPEPEVLPDVLTVILDRPAIPLIQAQLCSGHVHQPGDVGNDLIRELRPARREPAVQRVEAQKQREPELRRAPPARQLIQLVPDQRPVPNELVLVQHTRHAASSSLAKRSVKPPHTPRIRTNIGRSRSSTSGDPRKIP
jgi:hypothetical protein